ncbi:MAG: hypothetical protein LAP61_20390 [Acidobacteriia bacterium]|nr:hypothetical protein [Terriglobia bacterium]
MKASSVFRAGEWVEVRSKEDILRTLDNRGQLEELPFMPEMFEFCGQRFRVFKRAHKTCDPPNGFGGRRMLHAVHLEGVRCDGKAHGGCEARCLVFWKEAWLKKVDDETESGAKPQQASIPDARFEGRRGCTESDVVAGTRSRDDRENSGEQIFICQSSQLSQATQPIQKWDLYQYAEDYLSGNVPLLSLLTTFLLFVYREIESAGLGLGSALRWVYDIIQRLYGGTPYPWRIGKIAAGATTPSAKLDLQPGELVRIRNYNEILPTVNENGYNRGMSFDPEMVPYCGRTYRVLARINQIINEKTGKMQRFKNECIVLDGVVCMACYARYRRFCPRSIYPYWREIWLERVGPNTSSSNGADLAAARR